MNANVEASHNHRLDLVKWLMVWLLLGGAVYGFYHFSDSSLLLRVVGLLAVAGVAGWIASQTEKGRASLRFLHDAHIEVRKVVWPTRQETLHMTLIVLVMVTILSILVYIVDGILFWIVKLLTG